MCNNNTRLPHGKLWAAIAARSNFCLVICCRFFSVDSDDKALHYPVLTIFFLLDGTIFVVSFYYKNCESSF